MIASAVRRTGGRRAATASASAAASDSAVAVSPVRNVAATAPGRPGSANSSRQGCNDQAVPPSAGR